MSAEYVEPVECAEMVGPEAKSEPVECAVMVGPEAKSEPVECTEMVGPEAKSEPVECAVMLGPEAKSEPVECAETVRPEAKSEPVEPEAKSEPEAKAPPEKTSDYYRVCEHLPVRFNNPGWFRGYRTKEAVSVYRTSNQTYGSRAPTVHEMPKVFYPLSNKFSKQLAATGMFQDNTFNVCMEKSFVTGPDNYITSCDRLNFHPSYNISKPSICD